MHVDGVSRSASMLSTASRIAAWSLARAAYPEPWRKVQLPAPFVRIPKNDVMTSDYSSQGRAKSASVAAPRSRRGMPVRPSRRS